ncbi:MAG: tetratricopeptide repeat protein, partial [Gammaproteobacteria bacterium]|nr:tetratricopeptide repeat protein [Gammaproteobacteria bacterium]
ALLATLLALCLTLAVQPALGDLAEGIALYETGNITAAQTIFADIVATQPDNAAAIYHLGVTQLAQSNLEEAVTSFEHAVKLDENVSAYHQRLGEALGSLAGDVGPLKQMRMAGRIHDAFERAVELDEENIEARFGLITYYINAPGIAGGSSKKAAVQAAAIQKLDPNQGHIAFASVYSNDGEHEKAEAAYRAAIEAAPEKSDAYLALGIMLTDQERFADAIKTYEDRLEIEPDDMAILYQLGRTASISGQFLEQGRTAFEAYTNGYIPKPGEPSVAWANYRLGLIHEHLGENDHARAAYETALALDPKHKQAKKALRRVR